MDVLSEAKQKGIIRAHGCSCHSIEALRAAAASPWVEVDLVRINPIGSHMDADPNTVVSVIKEMKAAGKGIIGMKILGQGDMRNRQDEALKYALSLGLLDAFTIGAESRPEQNDLVRRSHSMISSALDDSPGGTSRPSAFAVFRLITNSNLVGCTIGRSAGFSPLRIRAA